MGTVLGTLGQLGYRWAYRVLDAQYFGVPQRRRRVFIVAHLGDRADPAEILFDAASLCGDSPEGREAATDVARCLTSSPSGSRYDSDTENLIAGTLMASDGGMGTERIGELVVSAYRTSGNCGDWDQGDKTAALNCATDPNQTVIAFQERGREGGRSVDFQSGIAYALTSPNGGGRRHELNIATQNAVRRLTPIECERLMGWPDNHTIGSDSARYRMCGNGVVAPVAEWIGRRIVEATQG